ncbi:MAG: XdhC family protein [Acidimicrobiales bacterium]
MTKRSSELIAARVPFVEATVVRAQCPTSVRPGDGAIVLADGSIEGFVGGVCAEGSVRTAALQAIEDGQALLLRILPADDVEFPETPGSLTVVNHCLSGGAMEVFLEPRIPAPLLNVVGATPIAEAVALLAPPLGFEVKRSISSEPCGPGTTALIVSSHGRFEAESLRAALDQGVRFIGLVASRARGAAVVADLELSPEEQLRVHTPVGIDIGARTAEEIALSIMAEVVRAIRLDGLTAPTVTATDSDAEFILPAQK